MSVEADVGFWKWVAGGLTSVGIAIWAALKYLEAKLEKKLDKHAYRSDQQSVANTFAAHREDMKELRDVLRKQDADAEVRHRELLMHLINKGK